MNRAPDAVRAAVARTVAQHGNAALADRITNEPDLLWMEERATGTQLWHVSPDVARWLDQHPEPAPTSLGEPWGEWERGTWTPSLAALQRCGATASHGRAILNDDVEGRFLYGREIFGEGIRSLDPAAQSGQEVWVTNGRGDVLGRARFTGRRERTAVALRPGRDLGWYLREGG